MTPGEKALLWFGGFLCGVALGWLIGAAVARADVLLIVNGAAVGPIVQL